MKTPILCAAVLLATSGAAAAAGSERLALLPTSGTNVHEAYLEAARDLLKDHLLATGRYVVITPADAPEPVELSGERAVARGRELGTDLVAITHLTRLGGSGRVRLQVYRVASGELVHADSIAIAGGPDDLDPALKRLAVGLASGTRAAAAGDIESVTQKESDPLLKQSATKTVGVRLGLSAPLNRPGEGAGGVGAAGLFWLYDARSVLGEVFVELETGENAHALGAGLGFYYPFLRTNTTPYLGGSAALMAVDYGGDGATGIRVQPTFGVLFGRLSTVQFRGELGYFANTFGERERTGYVVSTGAYGDGYASSAAMSTGQKHFAHGPVATLAIGY